MKSENSDSRTFTTARSSGQRMGGRTLPSLEHSSTQQTSLPVAMGNISQQSPSTAGGNTKSKRSPAEKGSNGPRSSPEPLCEGGVALRRQSLTEPCTTGVMSRPLTGGLGCTTLSSTAPTLTQHYQMTTTTSSPSAGIRVAFLSQVGRCFCLAPRGAVPLLFQAVRMAFPLDQGLQLDRLRSSGDLYFENSLEDHGFSGPWKSPSGRGVARCSSLSRLVVCSTGVRVFVLSVTLRRHRKPSSSLQLLDMSHRRWSSRNASVAMEFGDIHSLAVAACVTSKLLPERGLDVAPPQQQQRSWSQFTVR